MEPIIQIKGISKSYNITRRGRGYIALRDIISESMRHPLRTIKRKTGNILGKNSKEIFWALKDVNFSVQKGEAIGIIGANGAGKSTLLKVLSRITPPTEGEIRLHGKVASLLEVGTGFHPELSGRENIYLNGAILGMTRKELNERFDAIVEFSGIGKFIDTPVKRYSSGMYVRLAFSIAAHIEPDILLVDEVLAVGDAEFQKKCLGKMEEVTGQAGRTILFISHNMSAVEKLCKKSVLLSNGGVEMIGETKEVIKHYLAREYEKSTERNTLFPLHIEDFTLHGFEVIQKGSRTAHLDCDSSFEIEIDFETHADLSQFRTGVYVKSTLGDTLFRTFVADWHPELEKIKKGRYKALLSFPDRLLMPGSYFIELHASKFGVRNYLDKIRIEKTITVGPSTYFNQAHPTEKIGASLLMKNEWSLTRHE